MNQSDWKVVVFGLFGFCSFVCFFFSYPGLVADSESQVEMWSSRLKERAQCQNFVLPMFRSETVQHRFGLRSWQIGGQD